MSDYVVKELPTNKYLRLYNHVGVYNPDYATRLTKEEAEKVVNSTQPGDLSRLNLKVFTYEEACQDYIKFGREQLASVQHAIWAHWMKYQFSVCQQNEDGSYIIPADKVERWQRQLTTEYSQLTEKEKESDRHQADKVIEVLNKLNK